MSEKKIEILYISEYSSERLAAIRQHQYLNIMVGMHPHESSFVPYILKSKFDLLEAENQNLKNLLKMKIAGGGGGDLPLQGTGGYAGTVPQGNVQIIIAGGGAGGESHTEQKIEDNPDFTRKGGAFMSGKPDSVYVSFEAYNELSKELDKVKSELEKVKGRSNRKLSDRFTEILNKFTEEDIQRWIDFDANRMNGKTK